MHSQKTLSNITGMTKLAADVLTTIVLHLCLTFALLTSLQHHPECVVDVQGMTYLCTIA